MFLFVGLSVRREGLRFMNNSSHQNSKSSIFMHVLKNIAKNLNNPLDAGVDLQRELQLGPNLTAQQLEGVFQ